MRIPVGLMIENVGMDEALKADHLDIEAIRVLVNKVERDNKKLDILINDIYVGGRYMELDRKLWEHDIMGKFRTL